jgi:hypothetical protein
LLHPLKITLKKGKSLFPPKITHPKIKNNLFTFTVIFGDRISQFLQVKKLSKINVYQGRSEKWQKTGNCLLRACQGRNFAFFIEKLNFLWKNTIFYGKTQFFIENTQFFIKKLE